MAESETEDNVKENRKNSENCPNLILMRPPRSMVESVSRYMWLTKWNGDEQEEKAESF